MGCENELNAYNGGGRKTLPLLVEHKISDAFQRSSLTVAVCAFLLFLLRLWAQK